VDFLIIALAIDNYIWFAIIIIRKVSLAEHRPYGGSPDLTRDRQYPRKGAFAFLEGSYYLLFL